MIKTRFRWQGLWDRRQLFVKRLLPQREVAQKISRTPRFNGKRDFHSLIRSCRSIISKPLSLAGASPRQADIHTPSSASSVICARAVPLIPRYGTPRSTQDPAPRPPAGQTGRVPSAQPVGAGSSFLRFHYGWLRGTRRVPSVLRPSTLVGNRRACTGPVQAYLSSLKPMVSGPKMRL
jgi:hypothetical protein